MLRASLHSPWLYVFEDVFIHCMWQCICEDLQDQWLVDIIVGVAYQLFKSRDKTI
jgi:hypothetical protein